VTCFAIYEAEDAAPNLRACVLRRCLRDNDLHFDVALEPRESILGLYPQIHVEGVRIGGGEVAFEYLKRLTSRRSLTHDA
jgi:hypothetical protein